MIITVSTLISVLSMLLLLPWGASERPPDPRETIRPILLAIVDQDASQTGFDSEKAARSVLEGAALRLEAKGIQVEYGEDGKILIAGDNTEAIERKQLANTEKHSLDSEHPLTLAFGFATADNQWASGSETRFGGDGDAPWRLAFQIQRHLVRGMWDVMAYDSYDRGIVEELGMAGEPTSTPVGVGEDDAWVATFPLFASNPQELALLERSGTLELLSSALANALYDYLDPTRYTPQRSSRLGWRVTKQWKAVDPQLFYKADHSQKIALTFDGGASSAPTPAILEALRAAGVRATMFMTADFVERNPELVIQMAKDGHEFGNHSSTHPDMTRLSDQAIVDELDRLESSVMALTGRSTRPWFRPPYGACDDRLAAIAAEQGYYPIMWTADSADWREEISPITVRDRLLTYATPGAILIQHLGSPQSAQILADTLRQLKSQGISFGTLSEVLGINR